MNRKAIDRIMPMLNSAPRWAITLFDQIPEHGRPPKALGEGHYSILAWLEWFLLPEYYICRNRNTIFGGLPGLIPLLLIVKLVTKIFKIIIGIADKQNKAPLMWLVGLVCGELFCEFFSAMFSWFWMTLIYPIVPWFITDLYFYGCVYIHPLFSTWDTVCSILWPKKANIEDVWESDDAAEA